MRLLVNAWILGGATLLASPALSEPDPERGRDLYRPCAVCHMIGDNAINRVGPQLNGIIGRPAAVAEGFRYSEALIDTAADGFLWTEDTIDAFLVSPRDYIPGIRMVYRGLADPQDRADLVAYLIQEGGPPDPIYENASAELLAPSPEVEAILAIPGDFGYGQFLSSECTACHRDTGGEDIPSIAGLAPVDFIASLVDYRSGVRQHQVMQTITRRLGDEEISALAAYFEAAD